MTLLKARAKDGKIRLHLTATDELVFMVEDSSDTRPCKCCSFDCASELTVEVSFCGMTATETLAIPAFLDSQQVVTLPDGSYIILSAQIYCTPCGWVMEIGVCAYCDATQEAAADAFTATVPFSPTAEADGTFCPETGAVTLECFGDQFGIPCITTTTATIA